MSYADLVPSAAAEDLHDTASTSTLKSAASKVFALPELLEAILLHVSLDACRDGPPQRSANAYFPFPAKPLFVLQRVNSTFRAIITHNKIIQRRMLLAPHPVSDMGAAQPGAVVSWFGDEMTGGHPTEFSELYDQPFRFSYAGLWISPRLLKALQTAVSDPKASWRSMKIHCVDGGEPLRVLLTRDFGGAGWMFRFEDGVTLGELHDALLKVAPAVEEYRHYITDPMLHETMEDLERQVEIEVNALARLREECKRDDLWE
ncbi:uncharacterized protein RCC_05146 [Ramularia collo-cygni]|uniref:Uncharacterized protein n=1 Tax=Ramularia collo-cygni TaxID=112498 RepID=A0A2D3UVJ0_9PEZI|nr:uncharacterized protein RCC_05146 [Ramularia collo-cygni]CZT19298.1 uncharacterized protein RCC_05146 [Ramularia collo-cygni]